VALPARQSASRAVGKASPRIAPPVPTRSLIAEYRQAAADIGMKLVPWQDRAGRYMTATDGKRWRYREVAIVVGRQNGKTEMLKPRIVMGLRRGERILHTAQNRTVPRETFLDLARQLAKDPLLAEIRFANGQELIRFTNGGRYMLVAPRPGVRGFAVDTVLLDEVREFTDYDVIAAIKPTLTASKNPQLIYTSSAGWDESVVLNDIRKRAGDEDLAYLEWSAHPDRAIDDVEGWREANPSMGQTDLALSTLEWCYRSETQAVFETERLCRWVTSMAPRLVATDLWDRAHGTPEKRRRPYLAVSLDPSGTRASAVLAWNQTDGRIACEVVAEVHGLPIDTEAFGTEIRQAALKLGVVQVGFDDWTDKELARYFKNARAVKGIEFANATDTFVRIVEGGRLVWEAAEEVGADLPWTARKPHESGAYAAVKASEEHPITAVLAAIRAVWLAAEPRRAAPRIH
jgi:hypothetical protein